MFAIHDIRWYVLMGAWYIGSTMAWGTSSVHMPAGELRTTTYADLKNHPQPGNTDNEFWTYHFNLGDNIQVILNYSRAELGRIKDPVCGSDLSVIGFRGKNYAVAREYPKSNFQFTDQQQGLRVHKNIWFSGTLPNTHRVYFNTTKKGVSYLMDLTFSDILPGKTWGDGVFRLGKEKVGIYIHIPRAKVQGILAINSDTLKVSGTGYMDHTFQTDMGPKIARRGYRYQARAKGVEVGYLLVPAKKFKQHVFGFGLEERNGELILLKPAKLSTLSRVKARGLSLPGKLKIGFDSGEVLFERREDRQTWSVLSEFSGFTKWAAKKFMGGEVLYFRGNGVLQNGTSADFNFFGVRN